MKISLMIVIAISLITFVFYSQEVPSLSTSHTSSQHPNKDNTSRVAGNLLSNQVAEVTLSKEVQNLSDTSTYIPTDSQIQNNQQLTTTALGMPPTSISLEIKHPDTDTSPNIDGIDPDMVNHGTVFYAGIPKLLSMPVGSAISFNIFGKKLKGNIERQNITEFGSSVTKVNFGNKQYMLLFSNKGESTGQIYTDTETYTFQHNGKTGAIMTIYEYKKIKNALIID